MGISPRHQGDAPEWADANCRAVLEAAPDAMLVVNRTGEVVAANQQATKLYGYSREHLIGMVVESLIPARLRDRHRQHRENFFANPETQAIQVLEIFAVRSDASEIPVDVSLKLLTIGTETFAISAVRDATEHRRLEELKRAEAVLREKNESEERFRLAAQAGKMYAYEWDVATDLVVRSEEQTNVLGFSQPRQLTRQGLLARVHPEDRALFVASVDQLTPQYPTTQISYRVLRPDGSIVWLEKNARGFFDDQGKLLRVIGMVANITERKQAEEAVRTSEERLRLAQQIARIGSFEWNVQTGVNTWTPELEAMYGLQPGTFTGTQTAFDNLVHVDDRASVIKLVDAATKSGQPTKGEWRVVWADGSVHWIAGRWQVFMDACGEPSKMIGVNIDVTERKLADEALRESEEKFRSVFRDAGVGMVIVSPEGRFLATNGTFCDCLGYTEEELVARTVESVTFPEDWPAFSQKLREALTDERGFQWFQKRCLHKSGRIVYTESSASLIRNRNGEPQYFVGEVLDITERKLAEAALGNVSRKLIEAQEQERTRIGRELHDDIGQRLAMVAVRLQQVHEDSLVLPEVRNRMGDLKKEISEIANDIQSLSHELHSAKLQYLGLAAAMRSFCKDFGEQQKVEIDFQSHDLPSPLSPDISLGLFRVLQEALHNSAKHSGVLHFEVRLWGTSDAIHLTVKDSGLGFDREVAKESRGLGLISMEERLKLVNGTLSIDSQPQHGTTIHARVPVNSGSDSMRAAG